MRHVKRHLFSLMEVMVAILLVSIVVGISTFSIIPFYQTYQFRIQMDALYELMRELQLETMALCSDMKIRFTLEKGKWRAVSLTDEAVLKSQVIDLSHVDQFKIGLVAQDLLTLTFYSNGYIQPAQILSFSYKNERRDIDLTHPPLIKLTIGPAKKWEILDIPRLDKVKLETEKKEQK